jgi:exonuclease VII large subunit
LADIPLETLRPEFVEQVHTLRRKVMNRIKPKQLNSKPLNGEMLYNLAKSYVDSINSGAVPSIESSWSYICKNECQKAMMDAYQIFEKRFYDSFSERCPMLEDELRQIFKSAKVEAMTSFNKIAVGEVKETYHMQLKGQMNQKLELYSMENEKTSDAECHNFLQRNYNTIAQKLNNDEYDSLESLNFEILGFLSYFLEEGPKGPNAQSIAQ